MPTPPPLQLRYPPRRRHPSDASLRRFAAGSLDERDALGISRHLLAGCERCAATLRAYRPAMASDSTPRAEPEMVARAEAFVSMTPGQQAFLLENASSETVGGTLNGLLQLADAERDADREREYLLQGWTRILGQPDPEGRLDGGPIDPLLEPRWTAATGVRLCRALADAGRTGQALEVLERTNIVTRRSGLEPRERASLLMETARLLRVLESERLEPSRWPADLLTLTRRTALVEAQQLYGADDAPYEHAFALLRLAELVLLDSPPDASEPRADRDEPFSANLSLCVERLDALGEPRLALVARHYLVTALVREERWSDALEVCRGLESSYAAMGDRSGEIEAVLERGRIHRHLGQWESAEEAYGRSSAALTLSGDTTVAALAAVELAIVRLERGEHDLVPLADRLAPLFAVDRFCKEHLATLLLFRESCLNGTLTLAQARAFERLLAEFSRP